MSGNYSRNKGRRIEYEIRDYIRSLGLTADRVPASGAAQGFKGDIRFTHAGIPYLLEVKARKSSFSKVYEMIGDQRSICFFIPEGKLIYLSRYLLDLVALPNVTYTMRSDKNAVFTSKLHSLLGASDFLCIKDDRKPPLFLRFT